MASDPEEIQRLKAAVHYAVGKTCDALAEEEGVTVHKHVHAAMTEMVFQQLAVVANDLEHFANHAKRASINSDDVNLLCRNNPSLLEFLNEGQHLQDHHKDIEPLLEEEVGGVISSDDDDGLYSPVVLSDD